MEDLTGRQFGPYRIVEALGEGGMAAVYKAYQPGVDRYVAVKVLPRQLSNEEQFVKRFEQEAHLLANLQHPHILPVFDFGESEGYTYIVMPFIASGTLDDLLQGEPLPMADVQRIIGQVGDALDYAHAQGLVHRDIKPSNILLDPRGNALLSDFGIAKLYEDTSQLTNTGGIIGTPAYMSPEQGQGETIDNRSDIYSLGVVLYQLVTGRVPFSAETPIAVIVKHIQDPLPPPRALNSNISPAVERIILKALAKEPQDRFATAGAMVSTLRGTSGAASGATLADAAPASRETGNRALRRFGLPAVALLTVLFLAGGGWAFLNNRAGANTLTPTSQQQALDSETITESEIVPPLFTSTATPTPSATATHTSTPSPTVTATLRLTPEHTATPTATPTPSGGARGVNPIDGATLIFIPEGEFTMGLSEEQVQFLLSICPDCNADHFYASQPPHPVYLDAFWIYQTEVTNAMYTACVRADRCPRPSDIGSSTRSEYWGNPAYDDYPVIFVNWFAAQQYCEWAGARLPTDAEWEKAARGTDARIFPWGDDPPGPTLANTGDRNGDTRAVGSYPAGASPYGVLDMTGNVWEWTADWHDLNYYRFSPLDNPQGPDSSPDGSRSGRSGGWYWHGAFGSAAYHDSWEPENVSSETGFRCATSALP